MFIKQEIRNTKNLSLTINKRERKNCNRIFRLPSQQEKTANRIPLHAGPYTEALAVTNKIGLFCLFLFQSPEVLPGKTRDKMRSILDSITCNTCSWIILLIIIIYT